jgi:hypothetical protein
MRLPAYAVVIAVAASAAVGSAWAAANKPLELSGKAGKANFRVEVRFVGEGIKCTSPLLAALKTRVMDAGRAAVIRAVGADAVSKPNEFFLVTYHAMCGHDGGIAFANAMEDPYDNVHSYNPAAKTWSCVNRAGEDCDAD